MTVTEYREKLERNGALEMYEFVEPALELWSNNACIGYLIAAAQAVQLEQSQIERLVRCLEDCFDRMTLKEAENLALTI